MKLARDFNGKFNEETKPYIIRDKDRNAKAFCNLDFQNFELNLNTASSIKVDNPKRNKIYLSDEKHLLSKNLESVEISSNDLMRINLSDTGLKSKIIFKECNFDSIDIGVITQEVIFEDCIISQLNIIDKDYSTDSKTLQINGGKITEFNILSSVIINKFYINKQYDGNKKEINITSLSIKDTVFKENFKLHNAVIEKFEIEGVDFEKNADFFKSIFKKGTLKADKEEKINDGDIGFKAINFESLALFGDTEFKEKLIFKYVTFKGHNHFKSAKLYKGLDLEYTNIQQEINFYGIEILDTSTTSQETYRIIKHQFDKLGNRIESNKYHALELEQKKNNLAQDKSEKWLEYIVFKIHSLSSEHSTNWFLVLLWIILVALVTTLAIEPPTIRTIEIVLKELILMAPMILILFLLDFLAPNKKIYRLIIIVGFLSIFIALIREINLSDVLQRMSLINLETQFISIVNLNNKAEVSSWNMMIILLNKISLGYLYYQFLISVRKDTKK
ncbi:hypothetical protein [Sulfurimonas sp.]|uniref:hypothetical protein n=1 Tax=Sulfurimonas sp. TaxID=2022749 RepID=UPI00260E6478|nr:hypothetical protein [Sulfurimonas sp.]MCW8896365.1 hypothetical protein [Sulfurimonas sp.]